MIYPAGSVGAAMADAEKQPVAEVVAPVEKLNPAVAWPFPAAKPDDFETLSLHQE